MELHFYGERILVCPTCSKQIFLGTIKFGGLKKLGSTAPLATGLTEVHRSRSVGVDSGRSLDDFRK